MENHKLNKRFKYRTFIIIAASIILIYFYVYPKSYPLNKAISNGDTILYSSGVYNEENLRHFIDSVAANKKSRITVTSYSKEGYPTIVYLQFQSGIGIECTLDNTRNIYGRKFFKEKLSFDRISINHNNDVFLIDEDGKSLLIYQFQNN